ncbi:P-type conjugative transfer protein TrbL [Escherichia coli]|nr:P-type conjugative transfer protein TrbL [Escherichia coli]EDV1310801.1 P-type conjugative transfer protein TrbL [Salmonella enterica subsp. enterica]EDW2337556.1 P-type conjugative transfer protein TrbL [Salmonella enterica subsp. enterica]MDO2861540.1 P-type conjugative transfer protein TrbL [Escherichia coli]
MKLPANLKSAMPLIVWLAFFVAAPAHAAIDNSGVLDNVLARYSAAAASWAGVITDAATWLFWTLVVISMVWTFGMMALRKADIGEFFAEFVRFTIFTGFFWWLLINGPNFASSIYDSLRQIAGNATGLGSGLSPSGVVDVGFEIFDRVLDQSSVWSPVDSFAGILMALIILVILALIGINMLLLLAAGWMLAYGGVFFLGFGGSRWTSDMAINYYKTVLGVAAQLMAMVLLIGIGKTFLDDYYNSMSEGISLKEMGVMLIVAVILLVLVTKVPQMLAGVITGASVGGAGIGSFGAGAALGAAGMAAAAAATGGAAIAAGASNILGGAQALMAAFNKASENVANGSDIMSAFSGGGGDGGGSGGGMPAEESTGDTPFAQAAGFGGESSGGAQASGGGESSGSSDQGSTETASTDTETGSADRQSSSEGQGDSSSGDQAAKAVATGGFMAGAAKAGRIAADTGANLAKGTGAVAKAKAGQMKAKALQRIGETTGGKIAAAIKGQGQGGQGGSETGNAGDSGSSESGASDSSPSFDSDSLSGGNGGGWENQTGGFDALSSEDQDKARQSHAEWQARDPEKHTFDVGDYVSYAQERQQERNEEVASFVNKGRSA